MSGTDTTDKMALIDIAVDPTPKDVRRIKNMLVQVTGLTGAWQIELEGSIDKGATWWPITTVVDNVLVEPVTSPLISLAWSHIRLRVVTADTGTPVGYVRGYALVD